jgi:chaperonin cofactor prefoldin
MELEGNWRVKVVYGRAERLIFPPLTSPPRSTWIPKNSSKRFQKSSKDSRLVCFLCEIQWQYEVLTFLAHPELEGLVDARQKLESQQQENEGVQTEFAGLDDESKIYKLVGPVLLKQDKTEATMAVNGRLEFIEKEMSVLMAPDANSVDETFADTGKQQANRERDRCDAGEEREEAHRGNYYPTIIIHLGTFWKSQRLFAGADSNGVSLH